MVLNTRNARAIREGILLAKAYQRELKDGVTEGGKSDKWFEALSNRYIKLAITMLNRHGQKAYGKTLTTSITRQIFGLE